MSEIKATCEVSIELEGYEKECLRDADAIIRHIKGDMEDSAAEYTEEYDIVSAASDAMHELLVMLHIDD